MKVAIIGSEERKFTARGKADAVKAMSVEVLGLEEPPIIVSGHCHLGGVDIWAEELANALKIPTLIFAPEVHQWEGFGKIGYKQRNIQIADAADLVLVIVVASLPPGYPPEPWNRKPCYHCASRSQIPDISRAQRINKGAEGYTTRHVKSGACWTAWYAVEQMEKKAKWIVI